MDETPNTDHDLIGLTVSDAAGDTLGVLTVLFVDAGSGVPLFAGVTSTRRYRRRTRFVPLDGATVRSGAINLRCGGLLARRAPSVPAGQLLTAEGEARLFAHYDMPYRSLPDGSTRLLPAPGYASPVRAPRSPRRGEQR